MKSLLALIGKRPLSWLLVGLAASLALSVFEVVLAILLNSLLVIGFGKSAMPTPALPIPVWSGSLMMISSTMLLLGALHATGNFLVGLSYSKFLDAATLSFRRLTLYEMLVRSPWSYVPTHRVHDDLAETSRDAALCLSRGGRAFCFVAQCGVLLVMICYVAWRPALVGLAGLIIVGGLTVIIQRKARDVCGAIPGRWAALLYRVEMISRNTVLIRVLRTQEREYAKLLSNLERHSADSYRANLWSESVPCLSIFMGTVLIVSLVVVTRHIWSQCEIVGVSFFFLFARLLRNINCLMACVGAMLPVIPYLRRAVRNASRFSREEIDRSVGPDDVKASSPQQIGKSIGMSHNAGPVSVRVANVSYRYPGEEQSVLHDLSFSVRPGTQLGIVGPSGSGKSTLISLLLGIVMPSSGTALIDGRPANEYLSEGMVRLGYVGPEPLLIAGSFRENIVYGARGTFSDDEIEEALRVAHLSEEVHARRDGLDSTVSELGDGLSAGQKQRLALARAFLVRPQLLILDEASANLDADTEWRLVESLRALRGRCTVIIVSHRPAMLAHADQTYELPRGVFHSRLRVGDQESIQHE